jgi:hypothetical protein
MNKLNIIIILAILIELNECNEIEKLKKEMHNLKKDFEYLGQEMFRRILDSNIKNNELFKKQSGIFYLLFLLTF